MRTALTARQLIQALKKRANLDAPVLILMEWHDGYFIGRCKGIAVNTKPDKVWIYGIQVVTTGRKTVEVRVAS